MAHTSRPRLLLARALAAGLAAGLCAGCAKDLDGWVASARSPDAYERLLAVGALADPDLARDDPIRVWRALARATKDPDARVKARASALFGQHRDLIVNACLIALCANPKDEEAGRQLLQIGPKALPSLARALVDPRCGGRVGVARTMAAIGSAAVPHFVVPLASGSSDVKAAALIGVELLGPEARNVRAWVEEIRDGSTGGLRHRAEQALLAIDGE